MPVTTYPSGQAAVPHAASTVSSPQDLLSQTNRNEYKRAKSVIQSSFLSEDLTSHSLVGANNGFVHAAVVSYSKHHHLSIRPEDIWITILIQFGLYVNANAERLRSLFVQHEGKKELTVIDYGTIETQDFGKMAMDMKNAIGENVVDNSLTAWIMPSFSTTTSADEIASAISLMSTLKEYFSCKFMLLCGLPSVTLLGEKSDWENILQRLDKLSSFGSESEHWSKLLKPILRLFVKTFDDPDSTKIKDFWQNIFHSSGGGSGPTYYSGWITAFAFWGDDGKLLNPLSEDVGTRRSFGRRNEVCSGFSKGLAVLNSLQVLWRYLTLLQCLMHRSIGMLIINQGQATCFGWHAVPYR